jgi:Zn-dependent peptidase ImmA (M78 family)
MEEKKRNNIHSVILVISEDFLYVQNKMHLRQHLCNHFNKDSISLGKAQEFCQNHPKIRLWYRDFPGKAFILSRKDKVFIVINKMLNSSDHELEHRKLLLHEIGHFLLHGNLLRGGALLSECADWTLERVEREATAFSLISIVPDHVLGKVEEKGEDVIRYMQRRFGFSREEAEIRRLGFDFDSDLVSEDCVF